MVQDYVSPVRVHKYTFEMVMAAYERRFPHCPQIPVVLACNIVDDSWSADNSRRDTTRRCQLNVDAPYLIKKMIGVDYIFFLQKNRLDLKSRVLEIEATNESFSNRVSVVEKCRYFVHPENPEWTCFEQTALLDVKNFFGLENTIEKIAMKQYAANIAKGKELIESFMKEVTDDGVMSLEPWDETDPDYNRKLRSVLSRGVAPTTSPEPVVEAPRHSVPGTSRSKHTRLSLKRSKSATRDESSSSNTTSGKSISTHSAKSLQDVSTKAKSMVNALTKVTSDKFKKKHLKTLEDLDHENMGVQTSLAGLRQRTMTTRLGTDSDMQYIPRNEVIPFRQCYCPSVAVRRVSGPMMTSILSPWDNILVLLVCALILMLLAAPIAFVLNKLK